VGSDKGAEQKSSEAGGSFGFVELAGTGGGGAFRFFMRRRNVPFTAQNKIHKLVAGREKTKTKKY
jgi:hypothetical protein